MSEEPADFPSRPRPAKKWRVLEGQAGGRTLPHSLEAEELLLSCILLDAADVLPRAEIIQLTPEAFYDPKHGIIFEVARAMWRKNLPVAIDTLAEELKTRQQLDQVGGYPFLAQVSSRIPTTAQATYFLEKVFEQGLVRAMIRDATQVAEEGYNYSGGIDELLSRTASKFQRLADFALRRNRKSQREIAESAQAYAQAALAGKLDKSRVTPLGGLPHATAAFLAFNVREEDWLILLGALRNGGKSTLARQHVGHNLVAGQCWVVFLLETSKERWLLALACMFAGLNVREVVEQGDTIKKLFPDRVKLLEEWQAWLTSIMGVQLWIFDDLFHLEDIERQIRELNRRRREVQLKDALAKGMSAEDAQKAAYGLDGVLGDHLHLVQTRREKEFRGNRAAEVSFIGRSLKLLAKSLDVPNWWCAQLNRGPSNDERRPRLSDLRDSGTLEQDADAVLLLHRPTDNKAGVKQTGEQSTNEAELIQAKRRNGPSGVAVDLLQHMKLGCYEELTRGAVRPGMPKPKDGYKRGGES